PKRYNAKIVRVISGANASHIGTVTNPWPAPPIQCLGSVIYLQASIFRFSTKIPAVLRPRESHFRPNAPGRIAISHVEPRYPTYHRAEDTAATIIIAHAELPNSVRVRRAHERRLVIAAS